MTEQAKSFTPEQVSFIEGEVLKTELALTLPTKDMNVILGLLGKYPFDEVNLLIERIHAQCQPQVQKAIDELEAQVLAQAAE